MTKKAPPTLEALQQSDRDRVAAILKAGSLQGIRHLEIEFMVRKVHTLELIENHLLSIALSVIPRQQ